MDTTSPLRRPERPNLHSPSSRTRSRYARAAVFSSFRPRDARAINHNGFQDRLPSDQPQRLDHIAAKVIGDAGQLALDHWVREAARTTGPQHDEAMRLVRQIASMIDQPLDELFSGEPT